MRGSLSLRLSQTHLAACYPLMNPLAHILCRTLPPRFLRSLHPLNSTAMFSYQTLVFAVWFLVFTLVNCVRKCGQALCRDEQVCCVQGNNTTLFTCCKQIVDKTYYNIAVVTRKLSGVLILLLLFAVGYFIQRILCSRTRQQSQPHNGPPTATMSQEQLLESCTSDSLTDPAQGVQLPSYDECKHLPTYEETVRSGCRGRPEPTTG
ncbi:hypothetical protein LDENG_00088790 [Lucifuga dentata]|nr:hypothetical protein LDENG_00088790 [Lucifuga dentata]